MNSVITRLTGMIVGIVIAAGSLSLFAVPASAQEQESRYLVELVIFRHLDQSNTTREIKAQGPLVIRNPSDGKTYSAAAADFRQLNGAARQIQNLQAYQLIRHLAWIQTAANTDDAVHANLGAMGLNPSQVVGSARLYTRRYLHLDVQLGLQSTGGKIDNSRRIRLNQIHYFDNPDFGVLALVSRAN